MTRTDKEIRQEIRTVRDAYLDSIDGENGPYVKSFSLGGEYRNERETLQLRESLKQQTRFVCDALISIFDD